jgi:hypothetical protein
MSLKKVKYIFYPILDLNTNRTIQMRVTPDSRVHKMIQENLDPIFTQVLTMKDGVIELKRKY